MSADITLTARNVTVSRALFVEIVTELQRLARYESACAGFALGPAPDAATVGAIYGELQDMLGHDLPSMSAADDLEIALCRITGQTTRRVSSAEWEVRS